MPYKSRRNKIVEAVWFVQAVLIICKLADFITISWWWVLVPLYLLALPWLALLGTMAVLYIGKLINRD
jgi:hypothetical protein